MSCHNFAKLNDLERTLFSQKDPRCVFISHKKEDEDAAIAIGSYLINTVGVNIYLDTQDCTLQEAVSSENDLRIVESIQKGLTCSSHLLCLVSDKTKLSWWVPYEIGFADKQGIDIAALKLKDVDDIPSYLKIKKALFNTEDFLLYISRLIPYWSFMPEKNYTRLSTDDKSILAKYLD